MKYSGYISALKHFLISDTLSKRWIYHPRRQKQQAIAEEHLAALMETEISSNHTIELGLNP